MAQKGGHSGKYAVLIPVLLTLLIVLCGCTGNPLNPIAPPKITTSVPEPVEPIVGSWTESLPSLNVVYTYTFNRDHSFTSTASDTSAVLDGKWVKTKTSQYVVTYSFSDKVSTFVYDPQTDTLYEPDYPSLIIYRTGRLPAVVTTTPSKVVLFSDDFSQWRSEWDQVYSGEGGKVSYSGGTVHIRVPSSGDTMYHQLHQNFGDFSLDVDTKVVDGTTDNWFGVDVREQDIDNYPSSSFQVGKLNSS